MSLIQSLMSRLSRSKPEQPDAFALRLERIQRRETRLRVRRTLFRAVLRPLEAAAL